MRIKQRDKPVMLDPKRDRPHGLAVLSTLLTPADVRGGEPLDALERDRLRSMLGDTKAHRPVWAMVDGAAAGLQRVEQLLRD